MKKDSRNQAYSQRQLRVGELIKQNLGEIFIRNEAKIPMLTSDEDNKIAPIYCATRAPTSKFPAKANEIGINIVPNIPIVININPARNFANITVVPLTG